MKVQKKTTIAMIAVAATVSVAGVGAAEAASKKSIVKTTSVATASTTTRPSISGMINDRGVDPITSVLAALVTKGTITQAQSDAITAALAAARPTIGQGGMGGMGGGVVGFDKQAVILSTLGIDSATLNAGFQAGKSLATIAGTKTQALIDALVAAETKAIDTAVTAGKMTAAQATTAKAGLVAHVTTEVNQVGPIGPMGGRGHGHGMGDMDGNHLPGAPAPTTPSNH